MKMIHSTGKLSLACLLLTAFTGCTVYVAQPNQPEQVYTPPPPPPQPTPVYVEPAPPPPPPAPAVIVIQSNDDFYAPLSAYGQWIDVGPYGRCWRPAQVDAGWRPYANGHWELSDNGWYWESDEPWAWATYHYGRWELTSDYGWVWVPQTEWAPAWVSWRSGGGYVGWAPMPVDRPGISVDVVIAPASFCFVEESHMHDPVRPTTVIVNNTTIINRTVVINKTTIVNKVVVNGGPRADEVERVSGRSFQKVAIRDLRDRDEESVAQKHPNLRRPNNERAEPVMQRKPEPRQEIPLQNARSNEHERPVATPVAQPILQEQRRPQAQPVSAQFQRPSWPEAQPVDNRNNHERIQREQNPPNNPVREARQPERPVSQPQPDLNNRERQPQRQPQAEAEQRSAPSERERQPAVSERQPQNDQSRGNGRNAQDRGNQERNQRNQQDRNARGHDNSGNNKDDSGNSRDQK